MKKGFWSRGRGTSQEMQIDRGTCLADRGRAEALDKPYKVSYVKANRVLQQRWAICHETLGSFGEIRVARSTASYGYQTTWLLQLQQGSPQSLTRRVTWAYHPPTHHSCGSLPFSAEDEGTVTLKRPLQVTIPGEGKRKKR